MNHLRDRVPHMADGLCQYAHQFNNKVLICKVRLTPVSPASLDVQNVMLFMWFQLFIMFTITRYAFSYIFSILLSVSHVSRGAMKEAER